jgi:hypothetical protein
MRKHIAFAFVQTYLWLALIALGAVLFSHWILYPNIFHDVPRLLETYKGFMVLGGPGHSHRPIGTLTALTGIGSVVLGWGVQPARYWILGSLIIVLLGEGVFSMTFFWPRITILIEEGTAVHSADHLRQVAKEFVMLHWLRVAMRATSPALLFVGFLKFYCHRITSQNRNPGQQTGAAG